MILRVSTYTAPIEPRSVLEQWELRHLASNTDLASGRIELDGVRGDSPDLTTKTFECRGVAPLPQHARRDTQQQREHGETSDDDAEESAHASDDIITMRVGWASPAVSTQRWAVPTLRVHSSKELD